MFPFLIVIFPIVPLIASMLSYILQRIRIARMCNVDVFIKDLKELLVGIPLILSV